MDGHFAKKEELEQKKYLLSMERDYNWQIRDKLLTIEAELLVLNDLLPESNLILAHDHNTDDDILLEIVIANMRNATKKCYIKLQKEKKQKNGPLNKLN